MGIMLRPHVQSNEALAVVELRTLEPVHQGDLGLRGGWACSDGCPSQCPQRQGAGGLGRELQWRSHPLHATQQWHLVSIMLLDSSENFPGCEAPYSCPFRLSLHSQQLSPPWIHSPNCTFQHPASLNPWRHTTQAGVCRAVAWAMHTVLTLSCLPQTSCCISLQSHRGPFLPQLISLP